MATFRYNTSGRWFKGNTHIHSTLSDGGKTVAELIALYDGAGYDFIFLTDHWISSEASGVDNPTDLLVLDGIEIDGRDEQGNLYHVVALGRFTQIGREEGFTGALRRLEEQGAMLILAHPHWSGNTTADALRHPFHAVEVYNHISEWQLGKGNGAAHWDAMLETAPGTLAIASDDAHIRPTHPVWNGGWICVNAPALNEEEIKAAIRSGNFYSSTGPAVHALEMADGKISFRCSPVRTVRLIGPRWIGKVLWQPEGPEIEEGSFEIGTEFRYARLEFEDDRGRKAWTNNLFC